MKTCTYCGRENEDTAVQCSGCGTDIQTPLETRKTPKLRTWQNILWVLSIVSLVQAWIRLAATPYDPSLGDGGVGHMDAVIYLWESAGVSTVFASLDFILRLQRKAQDVP